jgi:hypothetical protein
MRWNRHLTELLIFNFFFLEHVWPGPQNWWKQQRLFWGSVTVMHGFTIPLGMTSLLLIYV